MSTNNFHVGHVPDTYKGNAKFQIKASYPTMAAAKQGRKDFIAKAAKYRFDVDYDILTTKQVQAQWAECAAKSKEKAAKKRAATLASKTPEQRKKTYILCPHCHAHSKLLYSEMGGYQTRKCKNGHTFNYDKWIGDRLPMVMIFGNPVAGAQFALNNPVEIK